MLPPPRRSISGAAPRASAISEYALTSSASLNPSREVCENGAVEILAPRERGAVHDESRARRTRDRSPRTRAQSAHRR